MKYSLGRYVFGVAAIASGICALAFHDMSNWHQVKAVQDLPHLEMLTYIVAALEILGGIAVLLPRTARVGAVALVLVYVALALFAVPLIVVQPLVFNSYGNFGEQFSLVSGALILYACSGPIAPGRSSRVAQFGYYSFAVCVLSFGLEQLFYLAPTASLVPTWIPFGQMFWAVATTVAFVLAAIALIAGFKARLASQLNTAMLLGFGLLVWVPALFAKPQSLGNWSEGLETLAIAASAWVVTDYLGQRRSTTPGEV